MIVTVLTSIGSLLTGASVAGTTVYLQMRKKNGFEQSVDGLTEADRGEIASDCGLHVAAVQLKVSEFADVLADGDVQLRERLRQFEKGGGRP